MTARVLNRMLVAFGIAAVTLCAPGVATGAPSPDARAQQEDQKDNGPQDANRRASQERREYQRVTQRNQQALMHREEQRVAQYRVHLIQRQRVAQQQSAQLQRQNRQAQYSYQQQYGAGLRQQQLRIQRQGGYDYGRDLYLYTAPSYRYSRGGRYYETSQAGADLLRQSVNEGYGQGRLAGLADRQDHWAFNYRNSYAFQDANFGYGGFYVDRDDYNNYFREGFRRGYDDGYYGRSQYGTYANGRGSILGAVLGAILTFEAIR